MELGKVERQIKLGTVFTPSGPVVKRDQFSGRIDQVLQVAGAILQPGRHVVIYGERGVGKTSLANVIQQFMEPVVGGKKTAPPRINCATQDNFKTIWEKVFRALDLDIPDEWSYRSPDPDVIRRELQEKSRVPFVILDEFDRVEDDECLSLMADTIKALSDHLVPTKLVIVGVADSIDGLIGEHESVQRAIEEVEVPRMTQKELVGIVDTGLASAGMSIEDAARTRIGRLAEGLPQYVHELALFSAQRAIADDRDIVSSGDVNAAIRQAVKKHSLLKEYETAVQSSRPGTLFAKVLIACALAEKNRLGSFTASSVRTTLSRISGRQYEIPAFAPHLKAFTELDRGCVLRREGPERNYSYRFRNPLLQPFTIMRALADDALPEDVVDELLGDVESDV